MERILDEHCLLAHLRSSKSPKPGGRLLLEEKIEAEVVGRSGELFEVRFFGSRSVVELLEEVGRIPLPPYIEREADEDDREQACTLQRICFNRCRIWG